MNLTFQGMIGVNMKKIYIICIFAFGLFLCGCAQCEEKPQPNEQQLQCEHEYVEIDWNARAYSDGSGVSYDIYCPKCKLEITVSSKEWKRIQADMNYKANK